MLDHADAIQQFRNAVKADPKEPGVHFGLGYLLWCQSQFDEAARQFQLESENAPDDAESLAYWADSNVRLNRPDVARPIVEKALHLNSRRNFPGSISASSTPQPGTTTTLSANSKRQRVSRPPMCKVHWRLARLYQSRGDHALAQAEFTKTKTLTQAADKTVMEKLRASHSQDASANPNAASSTSQQPNP